MPRTSRPTCLPLTKFLDRSFTSSLEVCTHLLLFSDLTTQLSICAVAPDPDAQAVADPAGQVPSPFTFAFSQVPVTPLAGGSVKIADSRTFNISTQVAVSQVSVDPGAMRYTLSLHCILQMTNLSSTGSSTGTQPKMSGVTSCASDLLGFL